MGKREIIIVIASPSDAGRERQLLSNQLPTWFIKYKFEELCNTRILVKGWEDIPPQPGYAQDVINSKLIQSADVLLTIFRHKLGNPTKNTETGITRSVSGTAEELLYAIEQNKENKKPLAMVYYFSKKPSWSFNLKTKREWKKLEEFKKEIRDKLVYGFYDENEEKFLNSVCKDICEHIESHKILVENNN